MKHLRLLLLLPLIFIASSCAIEMYMQVNADYSGEMELKIDISEMMAFAGALDSISPGEKDSIFKEISPENEITDEDREVLAASGISNLEFTVNEEFITITYDYADINRAYDFFYVLDSSLTDEERMQYMEMENFTVEDDRLTIRFSDDGFSKMIRDGLTDEDEVEDEGMENDSSDALFGDDFDMSFMLNLFTIKQTYTFEREVVDVIDNDLPIRFRENKIYFTINFTEYIDEFVGKEIVVEFESGKKKKKKKR